MSYSTGCLGTGYRILLSCMAMGVLCAGAQNRDWPGNKEIALQQKVFIDLQVIDHHNLRRYRPDEPEVVAREVAQIKRNMDVAAQLGFTSYLLFQEEAFPELLTWGGKHEPDDKLRKALREVLDHATARGLGLHLHCNEFMWPKDVGVPYGNTDQAWETYRNALKELIAIYPEIAGFEVTADETSGALNTKEGVLKFHNETARALNSDGRKRLALMRTWQRVSDFMGSPSTLGNGDEPNVIFSVKNTDGDFQITKGFDADFIGAVKAVDRLLVEFDAWREHETHNIFPVYLGEYWAARFQQLKNAGVQRIGVRFNWNSGEFPITERPWANWVNAFTLVRLAENPDSHPDDILREFVDIYFPAHSREAAFSIYKGSFDYVKALYYHDGEKITDHGRVNRARKIGDKSVPKDWMTQVDARLEQMMKLIGQLPSKGAYKAEFERGAKAVAYMSKAIGLQLGAAGDRGLIREWQEYDPASYEELCGRNAGETAKTMKTGGSGVPKPAFASQVAAVQGDVYEAETARIFGTQLVRPGSKDYKQGATGNAYVDFLKDRGETVTWVTAELKTAGRRVLSFRYALDDESPRPMRLKVNGKTAVEAVPFVGTGDWERWSVVSVEAHFDQGANRIALESSGKSGPNLDHVVIGTPTNDNLSATKPLSSSTPSDNPKTGTVSPRSVPGESFRQGETRVMLYPVTSTALRGNRVRGTLGGKPVHFEPFRTSADYYYDVEYAWLAADGQLEFNLNIDGNVEGACLRTIRQEIPLTCRGSELRFSVPGPGHYYLQIPKMARPLPGQPDSGTFTVLFIVDDIEKHSLLRAAGSASGARIVTHSGIVSDLDKDQTAALNALLQQGGTFHFPAGIYRVDCLRVPSSTTIHLAPGSIIQATDSPVSKSAPFFDLTCSRNVRICGPGTIDGNAEPFHLIQTEHSSDITIEDVLFRNCASWAIHLFLVERATVRNVRVLSGKDGIDPDCAKNVTIESCLVMAKDDAIVVKTRKPQASTEGVVVRDCIVASDASALKIGTETRALIRDVTFENCDVFDSDRGIIMYARDGGPIENVTWRNIHMQMLNWPHETGGAPFQFVTTKRDGVTPVRSILVQDVTTEALVPSEFAGLEQAPLDGLTMRDITVRAVNPIESGQPLFRLLRFTGFCVDGLTVQWNGHRDLWGGVFGPGRVKLLRMREED